MQMFSSFLKKLFIFLFFFAKAACTTVFRFLLMTSGLSAQFWHFGLFSTEFPSVHLVPYRSNHDGIIPHRDWEIWEFFKLRLARHIDTDEKSG